MPAAVLPTTSSNSLIDRGCAPSSPGSTRTVALTTGSAAARAMDGSGDADGGVMESEQAARDAIARQGVQRRRTADNMDAPVSGRRGRLNAIRVQPCAGGAVVSCGLVPPTAN